MTTMAKQQDFLLPLLNNLQAQLNKLDQKQDLQFAKMEEI